MKKILFTGCLVLASAGVSFGQTYADVEKSSTETPFSMEVLVNGGGTGINWNDPTLRLRYFVNDNIAARIQVGLGDGSGNPSSESLKFYEDADGGGGEGIADIKRSAWNAQIGGEYHLAGTQKLSPYVALGINFGGGSQAMITEDSDGEDYFEDLDIESEGKYSMFGVGLGAGMDFYFVENVYLGLELGFGYSNFNYKEAETVSTFDGNSTTGVTPERSESFIGTNAALRLGWRF
ncbi:MAG: hypothetical protein WEA99_09580 [Brumimicrobium sp.]